MAKEYSYTVLIERDAESGDYIAHAPAFDGCVVQMKTYEEALAEIKIDLGTGGEEEKGDVIIEDKDPSIEESVPEEVELSQDQIKGILKTIKQNLLCGIPSHRNKLLANQEKFEALLED